MNDEGTYIISDTCANCGKEMPEGAEYCPHCGAHASQSNVRISSPTVGRFTSRHIIALLLAVIPGFFNIFGLGQLVLKRWSKAFVYISITILLYYLAPSFLTTTGSQILLTIFQVLVFMYSLFDLFGAISRGEA